ncbi:hypothetical protein [Nocardia niwae]|uniref:hypothetical protein n=1 Tax=Nocardia niwae TaxID=626084 RepID=UPI0007A54867|nr:hypothetical protein [Nocardia niwae]
MIDKDVVIFVDAGAKGASGNTIGALTEAAHSLAFEENWAVWETFVLRPGRENAFQMMMNFVRRERVQVIIVPHVGHIRLDEALDVCDVIAADTHVLYRRHPEPSNLVVPHLRTVQVS